MLEILVIVSLCKKMGELMRSRGHEKPFWFQFFVPVFWFGGEFMGGLIYGIERALKGQPTEGVDLKLYLVALGGAVLASTLYFVIAKSIPPRSSADSHGDAA
ncbi:MAG TPA: hypothetical protein VK961_07985 [Chthoniobacter sp.]|nr:hypothetical protein [Chthoniobacter sp.]